MSDVHVFIKHRCLVAAVVVFFSDAYENNRHLHLRSAVSDVYAKSPSNFSLLLKCVMSDMGTGECPVSFHISAYNQMKVHSRVKCVTSFERSSYY